ncbi:MAG: peptidoglycan-binding domain-containing protein, partial [Patescibacteria group bacterium]
MSNITKKASSIILSATTAIWLSGAAAIIPVANAQTVAELQVQIAALLAQINALQGQLSGLQGGGASSSYNYTRDLTVGSKGDDVTALQNFLASQSGAQWPAGQAATGYFGSITQAALANYQASAGISPAAGYFGPKTRANVASIGGEAPVLGGQPSTPVVSTPASGVAVSLASDSPSGSAISGAGQISVGKFALAAAVSAGATITGLEFEKVGVVSDTA